MGIRIHQSNLQDNFACLFYEKYALGVPVKRVKVVLVKIYLLALQFNAFFNDSHEISFDFVLSFIGELLVEETALVEKLQAKIGHILLKKSK